METCTKETSTTTKGKSEGEVMIPPLLSFIGISIIVIVCIIYGYVATKEYTEEVYAYITDYKYYDPDDYHIGYTSTGYKVYSRRVSTPHEYTYSYEYDGDIYSFKTYSSYELEGDLRLYINPDNPEDSINANRKICWKEFLNWFK